MVTESLYNECGGVLVLDFTNTVGRSPGKPLVERMLAYGDLLRWSVDAGTLPPGRVRRLRAGARRRPGEAEAVLERGRNLREAAYRVFSASAHGRSPARADLETLNSELAAALGRARVQRSGGGFAWGWDPDPEALDAPLWPVARSAADLLTSPERERVRECASETCLWLFFDRTKNRGRRWCEMKSCGNRAKVRKHRARRG